MADHAERFAVTGEGALERTILDPHGGKLQGAFDKREHAIRWKRFLQVVISAALDGFDRYVDRAKGGHEDNFGIRGFVLDMRNEVDPGAVIQALIRDHQIE